MTVRSRFVLIEDDVDWQYSQRCGLAGKVARAEDRANYTKLLAALRAELVSRAAGNGRSEPYLLTIAAPAGPSIIPHLDAAAIEEVVDWINVMTYDFHGAWGTTTGHDALNGP